MTTEKAALFAGEERVGDFWVPVGTRIVSWGGLLFARTEDECLTSTGVRNAVAFQQSEVLEVDRPVPLEDGEPLPDDGWSGPFNNHRLRPDIHPELLADKK